MLAFFGVAEQRLLDALRLAEAGHLGLESQIRLDAGRFNALHNVVDADAKERLARVDLVDLRAHEVAVQ